MNVKLLFSTVVVSAVCVCCAGGSGQENENASSGSDEAPLQERVTGGDKDAHGCITSAGYCWSQVQERCVRLWEDGVKLSYVPKVDSSSAMFAAYLVFAADSTKAEFFAPKAETPILLERKAGEAQWRSGEFLAGKINAKWVVKQNDVIVGIQAD